MTVLLLQERLAQTRQVILDRGHGQHARRAGPSEIAGATDQRQVLLQTPVPAPPLPGDRPALTRARAAALHGHPGLVQGPGAHRALAGGGLGDERLEHHEGEARGAVGLQLLRVEGELTRALPDRVRQRISEVARCEVDAVRLANMRREVAGEAGAEALEVSREPRAHAAPPAPLLGAPNRAARGPRGRRTPPPRTPRRPRRPRASAARNLPSEGGRSRARSRRTAPRGARSAASRRPAGSG